MRAGGVSSGPRARGGSGHHVHAESWCTADGFRAGRAIMSIQHLSLQPAPLHQQPSTGVARGLPDVVQSSMWCVALDDAAIGSTHRQPATRSQPQAACPGNVPGLLPRARPGHARVHLGILRTASLPPTPTEHQISVRAADDQGARQGRRAAAQGGRVVFCVRRQRGCNRVAGKRVRSFKLGVLGAWQASSMTGPLV